MVGAGIDGHHQRLRRVFSPEAPCCCAGLARLFDGPLPFPSNSAPLSLTIHARGATCRLNLFFVVLPESILFGSPKMAYHMSEHKDTIYVLPHKPTS